MRALITGCAGFIASHLTESLLDDGWDVVGVDCFNDNYGRPLKLRNLEVARDWDSFDFVPIDLARGELHDIVADADVVFHLAAEPGVRPSWGARFETYNRNNVIATQHLLDATTATPERRFVYASSSSIYGEAETFPTPETTTPAPFSPYGVTKLSAEHLCHAYHHNDGVNAVSLRYFSVYGPRQRPDMAFTSFCRAAVAGESLTVYGDGAQTRDFTYVSEVVAATVAAGTTQGISGNVYNIGGGNRVTLNECLAIIQDLAGHPLDIQYADRERGDVRNTGADIARAQRDLAYSPHCELGDGLRAQFEWSIANASLLNGTDPIKTP